MTATVRFCDQDDCVFWKEPNDCKSDVIEIERRLCVTYMDEEEDERQDKWLEEVMAARKEKQEGKHSKDLSRLSDEDALAIKMAFDGDGC